MKIKKTNGFNPHRTFYPLCLISLIFLFAATTAHAADPPYSAATSPSGETVAAENIPNIKTDIAEFLSVFADSSAYDEKKNEMLLKGNVKIDFKHIALETDELAIDREKGIVRAPGNVLIKTKDLLFYGKGLEYDYENNTGSFKEGRASFDGFNISSELIELSPELITMNNIAGTTCPLDCQEYHITAQRLTLNTDGKAHLSKISFYYHKTKLASWPSYGMTMIRKKNKGKESKKVQSPGSWAISPPSMGYAKFGGLELRAGIHRLKGTNTTGLYFDYYFREGMFTEARWKRELKTGGPQVSVRFGKQYKENRAEVPSCR